MSIKLVAALCAGTVLAIIPPVPQISEQFVLNVPRKGEEIPRITNLVLVADLVRVRRHMDMDGMLARRWNGRSRPAVATCRDTQRR